MSPSELVSTDPCTGAVVWRAPAAQAADAARAVQAARRGFEDWSARPQEARFAIARAFAERVRAERGVIAELISRETGKPRWEALTEADSVAAKVEISIAALKERAGERLGEVAGAVSRLSHRPHGVVAVLGPFNFPMHLPNGHIAPALLAGDAVVFKPSEKTPACGARLVRLWHEAGVPEAVLALVAGGPDVGQALVLDEDVDGVLFTGGARTGVAIHRALAGRPDKLLALELGGNNPLVAWDAEDIDAAAHLVVQSAFVSAGQRCSCARRLILPEGGFGDRLLERLLGLTDRILVGAPFETPQPFMGPVIDEAAAEVLLAAQDDLARRGGRVLRRLARTRPDGPFLSPGVIETTGVETPDEEHFGPLLQVERVADFEAAIRAANRTRFGLAAALISEDAGLWRRFSARVRAGVVNWNRPTTGAASSAPFGGVGLSGNHRPSAYYAADYCAYPVASLEAEHTRFRIAEGLKAEALA
ncbi:MAG: succinylglutamate-semialdehyde dehydrogenase [Caulobacteraceae bacterium]|nr:succinylglutamate-semialdehyde dehydrogenase [Caulobacteraceae bacterium]